jgi:uncharacterized Fe-S cluster protein YjdI
MHRLYETEDIAVFWNSEKCRHAKRCVTGCPEAFDITRKPWIHIDEAPAAKVWKAVSACPTGALTLTYTHDVRIVFDEEKHRSIALYQEQQIGECDFEETPKGWNIYHTEVDPVFEGKGIAKRLVYCILQEAERSKREVIPTCSFAAKILKE